VLPIAAVEWRPDNQEQQMQIRSLAILLLALSASFPAVAKDHPFDPDTSAASRSIQRGTAVIGSPMHDWLRTQVPDGQVADVVSFAFEVDADLADRQGASLVDAILADEAMQKTVDYPEGVPPPGGGRINSVQTTKTECGALTIGGENIVADITYTWRYQYTRDRNNDGIKDSDPKWVCIGSSWVALDSQQISDCL
jgi:hypothetical protein